MTVFAQPFFHISGNSFVGGSGNMGRNLKSFQNIATAWNYVLV